MDKESLIENILRFCKTKGEPPTNVCQSAGVGKSFISDIRRGKTPSVSKVADLAAYLGVTVSDLVGDADKSQPSPLTEAWEQLNDEGRQRLIDYAADLVAGGRYIKMLSDSQAV